MSAERSLRLATGKADNGNVAIITVELDSPTRIRKVTDELYVKRIQMTDLDALDIGTAAAYQEDHFRLHLPHHYLFTIRLSLGDVYQALGDFETALAHYEVAIDYKFINLPVEAPQGVAQPRAMPSRLRLLALRRRRSRNRV